MQASHSTPESPTGPQAPQTSFGAARGTFLHLLNDQVPRDDWRKDAVDQLFLVLLLLYECLLLLLVQCLDDLFVDESSPVRVVQYEAHNKNAYHNNAHNQQRTHCNHLKKLFTVSRAYIASELVCPLIICLLQDIPKIAVGIDEWNKDDENADKQCHDLQCECRRKTHEENGYQRSHFVENEEDQPSRRPPKEAKITRVEGRKVPRTHAEEDDVRGTNQVQNDALALEHFHAVYQEARDRTQNEAEKSDAGHHVVRQERVRTRGWRKELLYLRLSELSGIERIEHPVGYECADGVDESAGGEAEHESALRVQNHILDVLVLDVPVLET
mmetsp:Transcript_14206/g.40273  ORF Transcript_14206/g.40273 Transcript_14206/m.40273 type:complete len:328 (-) Transcript_14206:430-1413(-)